MTLRIKISTLKIVGIATLVICGVLLLINYLSGSIFSGANQTTNLLTIFFTGLLTGGLTCMAVQGGLLAATLAQREEERLKEKTKRGTALPIVSFLVAKLAAYTVLGFLLGWFGSFFQLSIITRVIMQIAVGVFMLGTALNILNVHPIFRYFIIQPPKFLTRLVRKQSKSKDIFAPAILGAFTIFIPCGTTQAMMALAIASGKPLLGAAILFSFIVGTSPVFFLLGYFATKLGDAYQHKFMRFAALALIVLAVFNLNNALALTGSDLTLDKIAKSAWCGLNQCKNVSIQAAKNTIQEADIVIASNGYLPNILTIKAGSQVTIHLKNTGGIGCIQTFTIPSLNIQKSVPMGTSSTITFSAPKQAGELEFMCSMGMYRGKFFVVT